MSAIACVKLKYCTLLNYALSCSVNIRVPETLYCCLIWFYYFLFLIESRFDLKPQLNFHVNKPEPYYMAKVSSITDYRIFSMRDYQSIKGCANFSFLTALQKNQKDGRHKRSLATTSASTASVSAVAAVGSTFLLIITVNCTQQYLWKKHCGRGGAAAESRRS